MPSDDALDSAPLEGVVNFRDVGKTINTFLGNRQLREGVFFRSARLEAATHHDRLVISRDLGVTTVIDLRTKTEHIDQQRKHRGNVAAAVSHPLPDSVRTQPLRIEGLEYHSIRVADGRWFQLNLLRRLPLWSLLKFLYLIILGFRRAAIKIVVTEVMVPRGLVSLGLDTLDCSTSEIRDILLLYASPQQLPSIVHCSHGKDRTGLICVLLLMILDVPIDAIEHDYFLTNNLPANVLRDRIEEVAKLGMPREWALTDERMVVGVRDHLDVEYGGLEAYLDDIGVGKEERYRIQENLLY